MSKSRQTEVNVVYKSEAATNDIKFFKVHMNPTQFLAHRKGHKKSPEKILYSFSFRPFVTKICNFAQMFSFARASKFVLALTHALTLLVTPLLLQLW